MLLPLLLCLLCAARYCMHARRKEQKLLDKMAGGERAPPTAVGAPGEVADVRPELVVGPEVLPGEVHEAPSAPPTVQRREAVGGAAEVRSRFQWALDTGSYIQRAGWNARPAIGTKWGALGATASTPVVPRGAVTMDAPGKTTEMVQVGPPDVTESSGAAVAAEV